MKTQWRKSVMERTGLTIGLNQALTHAGDKKGSGSHQYPPKERIQKRSLNLGVVFPKTFYVVGLRVYAKTQGRHSIRKFHELSATGHSESREDPTPARASQEVGQETLSTLEKGTCPTRDPESGWELTKRGVHGRGTVVAEMVQQQQQGSGEAASYKGEEIMPVGELKALGLKLKTFGDV